MPGSFTNGSQTPTALPLWPIQGKLLKLFLGRTACFKVVIPPSSAPTVTRDMAVEQVAVILGMSIEHVEALVNEKERDPF